MTNREQTVREFLTRRYGFDPSPEMVQAVLDGMDEDPK